MLFVKNFCRLGQRERHSPKTCLAPKLVVRGATEVAARIYRSPNPEANNPSTLLGGSRVVFSGVRRTATRIMTDYRSMGPLIWVPAIQPLYTILPIPLNPSNSRKIPDLPVNKGKGTILRAHGSNLRCRGLPLPGWAEAHRCGEADLLRGGVLAFLVCVGTHKTGETTGVYEENGVPSLGSLKQHAGGSPS